jgi:hypothetical protein
MSKIFEPTTQAGEFFDRLFKHILLKKQREFPALIEKVFSCPHNSITEREKKMFDNGYMLAVVHIFKGLNEHVTGFDFKSMPPETTEALPLVTEPPSSSKKVN